MRNLILVAVLALFSASAFATADGDNNESGPGPVQDHRCQTPGSCSSGGEGGAGGNGGDGGEGGSANQGQAQGQEQGQVQGQAQGQAQSSENYNTNLNVNDNTAVSGSSSYAGGGSATQGQSQSSDNSNSSNNSSSQSTNLVFEGTGKASHYNKYGNNVGAYAPAIYSSSACTAGGLSGSAAAFGMGVSIGGAKQDPQCQIRENARILSGLNVDLAIEYLCKNPGIDVGAILGEACKPAVPPVVVPEPVQPIEIPVVMIQEDVKG